MAEKAESTSNREYVVKFNLFRKAIKDKQAQLEVVKDKIDAFMTEK